MIITVSVEGSGYVGDAGLFQDFDAGLGMIALIVQESRKPNSAFTSRRWKRAGPTIDRLQDNSAIPSLKEEQDLWMLLM